MLKSISTLQKGVQKGSYDSTSKSPIIVWIIGDEAVDQNKKL